MAQEQLIKELADLHARAESRRQEREYRSELEEKMEKRMDALKKEWEEKESKFGKVKYEYDEDIDTRPEIMTVRKMIETPHAMQKDKNLAEDLQRWNDRVLIVSQIMKRHPTELNIYRKFREGQTELAKALDTATSGKGLEWMPEQFSAEFIQRMESNYQIANTIAHVIIPKGIDTLKLPAAGTAASIYKLTGSSSDDITKIQTTTPGTRNVTLDPVKLGARVEVESDMDEDSAVAVSDYVNDELNLAAARGIDDICINGDTSTTHQDSDVTSNADHRKSWNGFRKHTLSGSKIDTSDTVNVANWRLMWSKLQSGIEQYGQPEDLVALAELNGYLRLLVMAEVLTRDKFGDQATVTTGRLKEIFGVELQQTSRVRADLNASGVYDGITTNRTIIQVFNKRAYVIGDKRAITVKSEEDIETDRTKFVITARLVLAPKYDVSTQSITAQMYNINTTT
jgi:HK97 family phage major capsid protein